MYIATYEIFENHPPPPDWFHFHFLEEIAENWGDFSLKHFVGFWKQGNTQTLCFLFGAESITISIVIDMYLAKSSISHEFW